MKKIILCILTLLSFSVTFAQKQVIKLSKYDYSQLKKQGNIDFEHYDYEVEFNNDATNQSHKLTPGTQSVLSGDIACHIIDQASVSPQTFGGDIEIDDDYVNIPTAFQFCFYGTNYNNFYINSNGNITFGAGSASFTASGFPTAGPKMIAPFWADFDNRPSNNGVIRLTLTNTYAIITWDSMGYYNQHNDKRNTCQLIITDGLDPILPTGYNVGFLYEDMDWTTGDASQGANGFGGTPATVGINKGDGTTFVQVGRFSTTGNTFVSNTALNSGIDWLDYKVFFFNICTSSSTSNNIAPIATNISFCDTVHICGLTDTLLIPIQFIAPEVNQNTTVTASCPTLGANMSIISNTSGSTADLMLQIIANGSLTGDHTITYTAIDNGSPAQTTNISQIVNISSDTTFQPSLSKPPEPYCSNDLPITISVANCSNYSSFNWFTNTSSTSTPNYTTISSNCSNTYTSTTKVAVTVVSNNGCQRTLFDTITIVPSPTVTISGSTFYCGTSGTVLSASAGSSTISSYSWSGVASATTPTVNVNSPGNETVTIADNNGCTDDTTVTVTNAAPALAINSSVSSFCQGAPITLSANITSGTSYTWSGGATGNDTVVNITGPSTTTTYSLTAVINGCTVSNSITLSPLAAVQLTPSNPDYCVGSPYVMSTAVNPSNATVTWTAADGITTYSGTSITPLSSESPYTISANQGGLCPSLTYTLNWHSGKDLPVIDSIVDNESDPYNTILCFKDNKTLMADISTPSGAAIQSYDWTYSGGTGSTSSTYTITQAGTYYLTVTDANGCTDIDSITIQMVQPTLAITGNPYTCPGDTSKLAAIGTSANSYTITWSSTHNYVDVPPDTIEVYTPGSYTATITDDVYGCQQTQNYNFANFPAPNANFTIDPTISEIEAPVLLLSTSTITTGSVTACYWNFGDGTTASTASEQIHTYDVPGTYSVTLTAVSNKGCTSTVTMEHEVIVIIPVVNIITPNGDNVNNALYFKGLEFYPENKITIFNRWGKKIYEASGYDNKWTGADQQDGTYYYILEVPTLKYQDKTITSFFQIIHH